MAALFNESLRKVNEQQPPTIVEEDESPKRANRPADLQGFSILDEKWRSSSSDDSDDSLPVGSYISTTSTPGRFCKSVDFRPLRRDKDFTGDSCSTLPNTPIHKKNPPLPTMSAGGSRFKVVPVETRDPYFSPNGKHAIPKPAAVIKKEEVVNRSSRSLSDIHPSSSPSVVQHVSAIPVQQKPVSHLITPNPKPVYTVPKVAPTAQVKASTIIQPTVNGQVKVSSETHINTGVAGDSETRRTKRPPLVRAKTV
ncbi:hypothetical protein GCK72_023370 [Caenorhabditis remanei]|uniref:Uncharacterized protein n=1 Tax=Caenorhabditis remanei TaxID=31234 RepID=A0A6A5FWL9_CAERE|nr:hypothetical protein GCK72_023370 [Caenorhabditis remanei]KAF1746912.1 hypothetical protein GCK72_023370 [Caenorhabditis remanei]